MSMKRDNCLTNAAFIATILVVMCHVDNVIPANDRTWLVRYLGGYFSMANVANFFLLSGFFLAKCYGENHWYRNAVMKRLRTLLLPYVLWNLIGLAVVVLIGVAKNRCYILPVFKGPWFGLRSIFGIGWDKAPYVFPLWYIKTLFYFILLSLPLFVLLKRMRKWAWIVPVVIVGTELVVAHSDYRDWLTSLQYSFPLVQFAIFLAGAIFALNRNAICIPESISWAIVAGALWCGVTALAMQCPIHEMQVLGIVISMVALHVIVRAVRFSLPNWLTGTSFFIYALHWTWLAIIGAMKIRWVFPIVGYFVILLSVLVGIVAIALLLRRACPRLASVLSGGR